MHGHNLQVMVRSILELIEMQSTRQAFMSYLHTAQNVMNYIFTITTNKEVNKTTTKLRSEMQCKNP